MLALTSSLLMTSSCSQMVFTIRGSTGLAVTLSMLPLPLLGRDDVSLLIVFVFVDDPRPSLAAPRCHLLQLTPSRELMSTVFAARPGDRFSKDSKACNCNRHYSFILDPILPTLIAAKQSFVILAVDFFCSPSSHSMSFNLWLPM